MHSPCWISVARALAAGAVLALVLACASSGTAGDAGTREDRARGTTSVYRITRAQIDSSHGTNIATIIESRLSGVRVIPRNGDYVVRIRGRTTLDSEAGNALVLVDGVEATLGSVAVRDIESIEVLKDSATAIYGLRGANGVLLIQTRRR